MLHQQPACRRPADALDSCLDLRRAEPGVKDTVKGRVAALSPQSTRQEKVAHPLVWLFVAAMAPGTAGAVHSTGFQAREQSPCEGNARISRPSWHCARASFFLESVRWSRLQGHGSTQVCSRHCVTRVAQRDERKFRGVDYVFSCLLQLPPPHALCDIRLSATSTAPSYSTSAPRVVDQARDIPRQSVTVC